MTQDASVVGTATKPAPVGLPPQLTGHRTFTWFTPARRRPTEYEMYTVHQQSNPAQWLHIDWPVRFEDGTPPWSDDASLVKTSLWQSYRDPAAMWQRPFVQMTNQDQQALARLIPTLLRTTGRTLDTLWAKEILGRIYGAWPFVEYGLFLALSYGVRQAMSDTVQYSIVFQAADRLRLLQDIVLHLDQLGDSQPGFSDELARDAWMSDPALVPVREIIEHLVAGQDWVETLIVSTLVFEPLLGHLAKAELFTGYSPRAGDAATAVVLAGALKDTERHISAAQALVRLVCADPEHGTHNRDVIKNWFDDWGANCTAAAEAFQAPFAAIGMPENQRREAFYRAITNQRAVMTGALS
jgi:hypothetical protein